MQSSDAIFIGPWRITRVWQHVIFWLVVYLAMIIIYGYYKHSFLVAAYDNLFYQPVQMLYFYVLSYLLVPRFLLRRRIPGFVLFFILLVVAVTYLSRLVDVAFVDPYELRKLGPDWVWYPREVKTFWQKVFFPEFFFSALRGVNLVVWTALAIKLFKYGLERRNIALQAELSFLKNQVQPHFLFNTLNNLYSLTLAGSPKASEVVLKLSDLMRYMLYECDADDVALEKDLAVLQEYIALEKIRYEDRLDLSFSVNGQAEGLRIPPLLLLPLIENAFKHGAGKVNGQAFISAALTFNRQQLTFKVWNSKPAGLLKSTGEAGHIGLANLEKRLRLLYGEAYRLYVADEEEEFLAVLEISLDKRLIF